MDNAQITLRDGTAEDAAFIAECILASIEVYSFGGEKPEEFASVEVACARKDTLYSYCNAIIAECNGRPAGCMVSYPGDDYAETRARTFEVICKVPGGIDPGDSAMETGPGEYYLDSLAILPVFRGQGMGHIMMKAAIAKGISLGYSKFALIVAQSHPKLKDYYAQLGFEPVGELSFFGVDYDKCVAQIGI